MASRLDLQAELEEVIGNRNVYFQPPASVRMQYPCIRYSNGGHDARHANDLIYKNVKRYEGIVIDSNPDSTIPDAILFHFPMCSFRAAYTADNLNHFPFTLYY